MQKAPPGSMPGMVPPDVKSMMEQGFAQQAVKQKTNITQAPSSSGPGVAAQAGLTASQANKPGAPQGFQHQHTPRGMGTPTEEAKMAVSDVAEGLLSIPQSILDMLGLGRPAKDPQEQAELKTFHERHKALDDQQKRVFDQRMEAEKQKKEADEEMKKQKELQKKKMEEQQNSQNFIPHGKVSGQAALQKMQQDRKGMGGASG